MRRDIKLLTETSNWIFGGRASVCMLVCVGFFGFVSVAEDSPLKLMVKNGLAVSFWVSEQ